MTTPSFRQAATYQASVTDPLLPIPSQIAVGDLVLVFWIRDTISVPHITAPGFTMAAGWGSSLDADHSSGVMWKIADAQDVADAAGVGSWTWDFGGSAAEEFTAMVALYQDADPYFPFLGPISWTSKRNLTLRPVPDSDSPATDTRWITFCAYNNSGGTNVVTVPSDSTERASVGATIGSRWQQIVLADKSKATAGGAGFNDFSNSVAGTADGFVFCFPIRGTSQDYTPGASFDAAAVLLNATRLYKFNEDEASPATIVDHGSDSADGTATYSDPSGFIDGPVAGEKAYRIYSEGAAVQPAMEADETITAVIIARQSKASTGARQTWLRQSTSAGGSNDGWAIEADDDDSGWLWFRVNSTARNGGAIDTEKFTNDELAGYTMAYFLLDVAAGHKYGHSGHLTDYGDNQYTTDPDLALANRGLGIGKDEGTSSSTRHLHGDVHRVALFDGTLTSSQLATLMTGHLADLGLIETAEPTPLLTGEMLVNGVS